ncbi:MAG TPA: hypothetical protein DEG17_09050 [Cyanobacteria bacterium UBA11149]|nr:hypothetical protein [Cyanobacteria bacterium UBA11367]HBE60751.1 hypothetical protein [Cyanobacteria bacterium UBA11366]HBR72818.1 hypothetical protein [Cyanobacteria bacterium UBA11159]HBS68229.1 hypothetical protein [Cyanobacteria bacterium UBA11153]HBW89001.1 hypothetical protein [Cyanobacteria bacterium UBA11149]HCA94984.1 hypothetical protein [Cyanobacteria bacterium UBA9226]
MKSQIFLAGIVLTTAIATTSIVTSFTPAQSCMMNQYDRDRVVYNLPGWLRSPFSAVIALPGVALATGLFVGGRSLES